VTASQSLVKKAKEEGRVLVFGTVEIDEFAGWKKAFERKYPGIELEYQRRYVPGTPPPMAQKIMDDTEAGRETADAVIVAVPPLLQFRKLDLLAKAKSKETSAYPKDVLQPQGYWFPIVSIGMIQVYNPKLVSAKELPRTALDLVDPKWKGAIVAHDLGIGTLGAYWLASLRPILGEQKWKKLTEGLAKNKTKLYPLYDTVVDSVDSGEEKIGLTVLLHDYLKAVEAKRQLRQLKLKDVPTMLTFNAIAKTTAGRHPASTQLLIDFLLSEEGQKLVGSTYLRIPARTKVDAPYSLDKVAPKEKFVSFPNEATLKKAPDSIATLARLFGTRKHNL